MPESISDDPPPSETPQEIKKWDKIWMRDLTEAISDPLHPEAQIDKNIFPLFVESQQHIINMIRESEPHSFQEYMALAYFEAMKAYVTGNNPVGAIVSIRSGGWEIIFGDHNRTTSRHTKGYHAEQGVLTAMERFYQGNVTKSAYLYSRPDPEKKENILLATTREPCTACTGRILITRPPLKRVLIGNADPTGGNMLHATLPADFQKDLEQSGLEVILADPHHDNVKGSIDWKHHTYFKELLQRGKIAVEPPITHDINIPELLQSSAKEPQKGSAITQQVFEAFK